MMEKDLKELLCTPDPADAAPQMFIHVHDIIAVSHEVLLNVSQDDAQRMACAVSGLLEIAMVLSRHAEEGFDELARTAKRGAWRPGHEEP